jgi:hypothetical protein
VPAGNGNAEAAPASLGHRKGLDGEPPPPTDSGDHIYLINASQTQLNIVVVFFYRPMEYCPPDQQNCFEWRSHGMTINFSGFGWFDHGVTVAQGNFNGGVTDDLVLGAASGSSLVLIYDGQVLDSLIPQGYHGPFDITNQQIPANALIYENFVFPGFTGGVFVALGDVNNGPTENLIVGSGPGASLVEVYQYGTPNYLIAFNPFFDTSGYVGGVTVAAGDLTDNLGEAGRADIITGMAQGGDKVGAWLYYIQQPSGNPAVWRFVDFHAENNVGTGVNVGAGILYPSSQGGNNITYLITAAASGNSWVGSYSYSGDPTQPPIYNCGFFAWPNDVNLNVGASVGYSNEFSYFIVGTVFSNPIIDTNATRMRYYTQYCTYDNYEVAYSPNQQGVYVAY